MKYMEDSYDDDATPMVGRDQELRELLELCTLSEEFCAVHLKGEPGIGKTRLLKEVESTLELEGRCVISSAAVHYEDPLKFWSTIVDAMVTAFFSTGEVVDISRAPRPSFESKSSFDFASPVSASRRRPSTDSPGGSTPGGRGSGKVSARGSLVQRVAKDVLGHTALGIHSVELSAVLGAGDSRQNRSLSLECELTVEIIVSIAEKCANTRPFVILIDGIENLSFHAWQVIGSLTRRKPPLHLVAASRNLDILSADANAFLDVAVPMNLTPLPVDAVTRMFHSTLQFDIDEALTRQIHRSCGGSLSFLNSVLQSLQRIPESESEKRLALLESLANMSMEGNHRQVVEAQLGSLSMQDQMILKIASAIGASFESSVLARTYPGPRADVNDVLHGTLKDFVIRDESAVNDVRFVFKDPATAQIIYDQMLPSQSMRLHTQIAEEYQRTRRKRQQDGFSTGDSIVLLARHYHKSDKTGMAKQYLVAAGLVCIDRGLFADAEKHFNNCVEYGVTQSGSGEDSHLVVALFHLVQLYMRSVAPADCQNVFVCVSHLFF